MAQYTMTLRQIKNQLEKNNQNIFDDTWSSWSDEHKKSLQDKFYDMYLFHEIAFETPGQFIFHVNAQLRRIIDYYKELYQTTLYEYEPLENYNLKEESTINQTNTEDGENSTNQNLNNSTLNKVSDSPSGNSDLTNPKIITSLADITGNETSTINSDFTNNKNQNTTNNIKRWGNIGITTSQQLLIQEREVILRLDEMILEDLHENFLMIY